VLAAREMLAEDGGAVCSAGMRQSCSGENGNQQAGISRREAKPGEGQSSRSGSPQFLKSKQK